MLEKGTVIAGKYQVIDFLGKGGTAQVYLVIDLKLHKKWAIKEIVKYPKGQSDTFFVKSAMAEVNVMKKLNHPALPRIVDIFETKDTIYVVMDYIEGENLATLLKKEGYIQQKVVIQWAKELCEALLYLHGQNPSIIYRDMKPANIMIDLNGNIRLIDFGIAREYKEAGEEDTVNLGTRGYAAPEQFAGEGQTDIRTDIYNLGVTMHQLLTGLQPGGVNFNLQPVRDIRPELSLGIEYIVKKCTQQNPKNRYQNCKELLFDLNHYEKLSRKYWEKRQRKRRWKKLLKKMAYSLLLVTAILLLQVYFREKDYIKIIVLESEEVLEKIIQKLCLK